MERDHRRRYFRRREFIKMHNSRNTFYRMKIYNYSDEVLILFKKYFLIYKIKQMIHLSIDSFRESSQKMWTNS
jgi:Holliday junction resolvase RusA-like endonuclease